MSSENILILSPFFFPEPISTGKYNGLMASGLQANGHAVQVICSYPIYPDWIPNKDAAEIPGITTLRGGAWIRYPQKPILRRAILEPWFAWHAFCGLIKNRNKTDKIIAVFPPSLFMLAVPLIARKGTKLVGIVHDLQGVYANQKSGILGKILQKSIHFVEKHAFLSCSHLVFLSETMRDITVKTYDIDPKKTSIQYPFVTINQNVQAEHAEAVSKFFDAKLNSIVYSGALGEKQAPEMMVQRMLDILEKNPQWQARVFSQGPIFEKLKSTYYHPRLAFYPLVPMELLPALLEKSDIQIVPQAPGTSDGSLPSKFPNILAAKTRLLCITDDGSELAKIAERYENGAVSVSWSSEAILRAFDALKTPAPPSTNDADLLQQFTLEGLISRINKISF